MKGSSLGNLQDWATSRVSGSLRVKECWTIQRLEAQGQGDPTRIKLEHGTQEEEGEAFSQAGILSRHGF